MTGFTAWIQGVQQDAALAIRLCRKAPLFSTAAVLTLALGIAANTTIFSVTNAVLLNPLPFRKIANPQNLVMLWERAPKFSAFFADRMPVRLKDERQWQASTQLFSGMAVWRETSLNLDRQSGGRNAEQVSAAAVSANLLPLLGVTPRVGRQFRLEENKAGSNHVALLSDQLFRSRFGGDAGILGQTIAADGVSFLVVGVLPPGFELPAMWGGFDQKKVQLWLPIDLAPPNGAEQNDCFVYARLKPGVTPDRARSELAALQKRMVAEDKSLAFFSGVNVSSVYDEDVGPQLRSSVLVLQAAVGFVLLIACANVANLSLTRAVAREKEFAVRVAVGAGRLRLLRQLLTESLLLSLLSGAIGTLLAYWGLRLVSYLAPPDTHGLHEMQLDGTVLLYTLAVSIAAGLLFGLAPYFHIRRQDINEMMNRTSRSVSGSSGRFRSALIIAELALSVVLLIGAGLMIRTLAVLMSTNLGFDRGHLLSIRLTLPSDRYADAARRKQFDRQLLEAVRRTPNVKSAMLTTAIPMQSVTQSSYALAGRALKPGETLVANVARVSSGYFETLGVSVLQGRAIQPDDRGSGDSVAVVNQSFARAHGPEIAILGRIIEFNDEDGKTAHYRIVGVVGNERQLGPDAAGEPQFYLPGQAMNSMYLIARATADPLALAPTLQAKVWALDPNLATGEIRSMDGVLTSWTAPRRFVMSVLAAFAALAVLLASVGLFGVLAYSVSLRTREIGIRLALGAEPRAIARRILVDGCKLTLAGIALGMAAALALVRFLESLIYGVSGSDPWTLILVPVLLTGIALMASYAPARRAAAVDPIEALRAE